MWERKELKKKAKKVISKNYWTAVVICFVIALFTGEFGTSTVGIWNEEGSMDPNYTVVYEETFENFSEILVPTEENIETRQESIKDTLNSAQRTVYGAIESNLESATKSQRYIFKIWDAVNSFLSDNNKLGVVLIIISIIAILFTIFIADPLIVGGKRYFIKARKESNTKIGVVTEVYRNNNWFNVALIMFLKNLFNALWYLTIIGGIIKTYEYRMIPFILAETPKVGRKQAFKLSKQMMKGNKWKTFVLDMSFFGWNLLSVLTMGLLSIIYINPYSSATMAELYIFLKEKAIKENYEFSEILEK